MRQRRAPACLVHEIQLHPRPPGVLTQLDLISGELSLDDGSVKFPSACGFFRGFHGVGRASVTNNPDRIHAIRAETESPKKARRSHFGINFAVLGAVLHTDSVVGRNGAVELGGTCLFLWHVLTIYDCLGRETVAVLWS